MQLQSELKTLLTFVIDLLKDYGLDDFYLELSTRNEEKYVGTDENWAKATEALREAARDSGLDLVPDPGGAAFYGPKISVQARRHRPHLADVDDPGRLQPAGALRARVPVATTDPASSPMMIHRALLGSLERLIGVITEHYAGAFPPWLAPVQVIGIPVAEEFNDYLFDIAGAWWQSEFRVDIDTSEDRFGKKMRNRAAVQKVLFS